MPRAPALRAPPAPARRSRTRRRRDPPGALASRRPRRPSSLSAARRARSRRAFAPHVPSPPPPRRAWPPRSRATLLRQPSLRSPVPLRDRASTWGSSRAAGRDPLEHVCGRGIGRRRAGREIGRNLARRPCRSRGRTPLPRDTRRRERARIARAPRGRFRGRAPRCRSAAQAGTSRRRHARGLLALCLPGIEGRHAEIGE